ncbi:MAG: DUF5706 domain-containing protein [Novosphingobium sp.]|nr:hypothetical protein [Novosphingobium sp.]
MTGQSPPSGEAPELPESFAVNAVQMVRTVTQVNLQLSQMADQKASILMGATFVVFTISVGQASRGEFPVALSILALSAFLSAFCAVAAIMPSIRPPARQPDNENLLFFGVFTQLEEEEFIERAMRRIETEQGMFRLMFRDIYQNGQVLQRKKYRYLGLAYRIFMLGLTVTLITFLIESRELLTG